MKNPLKLFVRVAILLASGLLVSTTSSQAQVAAGKISGQALGGGVYGYTISLTNTGPSSLETFWFSWNTSGYNFMTASPTAITPPSGWTDVITAGFGYGIQFNTSTTPLTTGSTFNFGFDSTMTPTQMAGTSYLGLPVGTSYVSTLPNFGGSASGAFVVQPVPEPSALGLLAVSSLGLLAARRGRSRIETERR